MKSWHQCKKKAIFPFLNLQTVYFNLEHKREWIKSYKYNNLDFRLIPHTLWKLLEYFSPGIRIKISIPMIKTVEEDKRKGVSQDRSEERKHKKSSEESIHLKNENRSKIDLINDKIN